VSFAASVVAAATPLCLLRMWRSIIPLCLLASSNAHCSGLNFHLEVQMM
jgi:hypothetical protein